MSDLDQELRAEGNPPRHPPRGKGVWVLPASVAVVAAALGFAAGAYVNGGSTPPVEGAASDHVVALIDDMTADFNRGDMDAFAAHFTPDAVWEEGGNRLRGRDRIADAMQWLSDQGATYQRDGTVIQQGHMVAVPLTASMHAPGLLDVIEFNDGWKIVHYWSNGG